MLTSAAEASSAVGNVNCCSLAPGLEPDCMRGVSVLLSRCRWKFVICAKSELIVSDFDASTTFSAHPLTTAGFVRHEQGRTMADFAHASARSTALPRSFRSQYRQLPNPQLSPSLLRKRGFVPQTCDVAAPGRRRPIVAQDCETRCDGYALHINGHRPRGV
jgi:hypothetical protein